MIVSRRDTLDSYRTLWHSECIENKLKNNSEPLNMDFNNTLINIGSLLEKILTSETFVAASITALAAILGAGIAGYCSFLATKKAHLYNIEKTDREEKAFTSNTFTLIMIEIKTAWEVYNNEYANDLLLLKPGKPYIVIFPVGTNTFSLYDSSPSCLANLPIEIAEKIVLIYMRMKGLIAMIEVNNHDTRQAYHATEIRMQIIRDEMAARGRPLEGEDLESIYQNHINHEATKIGMGSTADGMKLLGAEIDDLYNSLIKLKQRYQHIPKQYL